MNLDEFRRILYTKLTMDLLYIKLLGLMSDGLIEMDFSNKEYVSCLDNTNFSSKNVFVLLKAPLLAIYQQPRSKRARNEMAPRKNQ